MPRKKRERKWRADNIRREILPFGPLLDFVNLDLTVLNWQDQLFKVMGEEKSCYVTYQTAETTKREKMLESDIGSNLQIELFGTAVVFDESESARRISEAIIDIEDVLPLLSGKPADLASAQKLREELRALLSEIASADLQKPEQQIRLRKKIEKNYGPKPLQRDAFLFPDGDVFFKSWLFESEEFRALAFFRLGHLFHELCRPVSVRAISVLSQNTGRKIPFKIYNDLLAAKIHGAGEKGGAGHGLKLSTCACGCGNFFLQCGDRDKAFINDQHRVSHHNALRAKAGPGPAPGA
jgi:hypothetical protein